MPLGEIENLAQTPGLTYKRTKRQYGFIISQCYFVSVLNTI